MFTNKTIAQGTGIAFLAGALLLTGCAGGPLTTREKGAGIGALGGAAAIGGALGLAARALVGDQLQAHEITNYQQQQQINRNQAEINRNRQDIQRLQRNSEY